MCSNAIKPLWCFEFSSLFQDPTFNFLGHHTTSNKRYHYLVLLVLSVKEISNDDNKIGLITKFFTKFKHHNGVNSGLL
jgi:hypothetical protein